MFSVLIADIGSHVNASGEYSMEFASDGAFLLIFIRFWRAEQLCRVFLKKTSRLQGQSSAEICLLSYLISAISTTLALVSCTGCSARTIELLDQSPYSPYGVQSPPRFEELNLQQLMHKKSCSVFGNTDFFSVLKYLVVSLGGCIELDWVLLSPELSRVRHIWFWFRSNYCSLAYLVPSDT